MQWGMRSSASQMQAIDTLNMSHAVWIEEVENLQGIQRYGPNSVSRHARAEALGLLQFNIDLRRDDGSQVRMVARSHDIRPRSLQILFGRYVHPNSECICWMRHAAEGFTPLYGRVMLCDHVRGIVHVCLIQLYEPIDVSNYLSCPPDQELENKAAS